MDYKVQFDVFEGPMDLLLYLVRKQEVDIYQVNLTQLATEFIQFIEFMRELDLEVAGEFVVMAATLMYIKSKELLPKDKQVVLGLMSSKLRAVETKEEIIQRIKEAAEFAPLDQLSLSHQCGFSSTAHGNDIGEEDQWLKLQRCVEVAREVWGD